MNSVKTMSEFEMRRSLRLAQQTLSAIGCANGNAGKHLGCEQAVGIMRNSSFLEGNRIPLRWRAVVEETNSGRHYDALAGVTQTCLDLAKQTHDVISRKEDLVVFGGDHSCAMGTWSGVAAAVRPHGDLGLIWVDAHMDAHTPSSTPSGNLHGMPVAHLLGHGHKDLVSLGDHLPKILPHNLCMVGIRSYEEGEQELLDRLGVRVFFMDEVEKRGISDVMQEAQYLVTRNTMGFGMSIDIDGFDVRCAPAVGTPAPDGIDAASFMRAVLTMDLSRLVATEIVEFLPEFDDDDKTSERLVASLVDTIYATKFFQQDCVERIQQQTRPSSQEHKKFGASA